MSKLDAKINMVIGTPTQFPKSLDLLADPLDAAEAIATMGIDTTKPLSIDQIGDGIRKTYATNRPGIKFVTTTWTKSPQEIGLVIDKQQ